MCVFVCSCRGFILSSSGAEIREPVGEQCCWETFREAVQAPLGDNRYWEAGDCIDSLKLYFVSPSQKMFVFVSFTQWQHFVSRLILDGVNIFAKSLSWQRLHRNFVYFGVSVCPACFRVTMTVYIGVSMQDWLVDSPEAARTAWVFVFVWHLFDICVTVNRHLRWTEIHVGCQRVTVLIGKFDLLT